MAGGEEGLALAAAFYSPDHPRYEGELVCPKKEPLPGTTISRGWAGLCFVEDEICIDRTKVKASRSPRIVEAEFTAQSTLFGKPGAERRIKAFIIPPANEEMIASLSPADLFTSRCRGIRHR